MFRSAFADEHNDMKGIGRDFFERQWWARCLTVEGEMFKTKNRPLFGCVPAPIFENSPQNKRKRRHSGANRPLFKNVKGSHFSLTWRPGCATSSHMQAACIESKRTGSLENPLGKRRLETAGIQSHFSWPIENATLRSVLINLVEKGTSRESCGAQAFSMRRASKDGAAAKHAPYHGPVLPRGFQEELVAKLVKYRRHQV